MPAVPTDGSGPTVLSPVGNPDQRTRASSSLTRMANQLIEHIDGQACHSQVEAALVAGVREERADRLHQPEYLGDIPVTGLGVIPASPGDLEYHAVEERPRVVSYQEGDAGAVEIGGESPVASGGPPVQRGLDPRRLSLGAPFALVRQHGPQ